MYPILVDVSRLAILVVGGGRIATRKLAQLLAEGARPTVIAPTASEAVSNWEKENRLIWQRRAFQAGDTRGFAMVFIATDRRDVNEAVFAETRPDQLVNDTTVKARSSFFNLALVKSQQGTVGITTFGADPAKAKELQKQIRKLLETE